MLREQQLHRMSRDRHRPNGVSGLRRAHYQFSVSSQYGFVYGYGSFLNIQICPEKGQQFTAPQAANQLQVKHGKHIYLIRPYSSGIIEQTVFTGWTAIRRTDVSMRSAGKAKANTLPPFSISATKYRCLKYIQKGLPHTYFTSSCNIRNFFMIMAHRGAEIDNRKQLLPLR